jgi:iron complex outermembrane receptor protein
LFAEEPGEDPAPVRLDVDKTKYDLRGELRELGGVIERLAVQGVRADYEHTEFEGEETGTVFAADGWEGRIEAFQAPVGGWTGVLGLQGKVRDFSAIGEEAFVPATRTTQWATFVIQDWQSGPWTVQAGGRFEHTRVADRAGGSRRTFRSWAGSAAVNVAVVDGAYLGASAGWSQRPPTAEELFSNGPHLATGQFEVGNPGLGEETALNLEVSARIVRGALTVSANAFRSLHDDFILPLQTGEIEDGLPVFQFSAVDARFHGAEVEVGWTFIDTVEMTGAVDASLDVVRAVDRDRRDPLPRIPPVGYRLGVGVRYLDLGARIEVQGAARQRRVAPGEATTAGHAFLNVELAWRPDAADHLRLAVQGRNLANARGLAHTSFVKDDAPLPGRDVRLMITSSF